MVENRSSVTIASRSVDMLTFSHQSTAGERDGGVDSGPVWGVIAVTSFFRGYAEMGRHRYLLDMKGSNIIEKMWGLTRVHLPNAIGGTQHLPAGDDNDAPLPGEDDGRDQRQVRVLVRS